MERKSLWRNFLVLTVGSLLALHINVTNASENEILSEDPEMGHLGGPFNLEDL
jgi:hypothetical protein